MRVGDLVEFRRGNQKPMLGVVLKDVHPAQTGVKVLFPSGALIIHRRYLGAVSENR